MCGPYPEPGWLTIERIEKRKQKGVSLRWNCIKGKFSGGDAEGDRSSLVP